MAANYLLRAAGFCLTCVSDEWQNGYRISEVERMREVGMGNVKILAAMAVVLGMASSFAYATIPITLIADTSTPDPSGGNFTSFGLPSSDRDYESVAGISPNLYPYNNVFFTAQGPSGLTGVYGVIFPGPGINEIYTIVDSTMQAATGGNFASFSNTTSGGGEAGFIATDTNGNQSIYDYDGYGLHFIASSNTSPASGITFGSFTNVSVMSSGPGGYVPAGEINSSAGIYDFAPSNSPNSWAFTLVANTTTIPYGTSSPVTSLVVPENLFFSRFFCVK
jgi:hypothetical protein